MGWAALQSFIALKDRLHGCCSFQIINTPGSFVQAALDAGRQTGNCLADCKRVTFSNKNQKLPAFNRIVHEPIQRVADRNTAIGNRSCLDWLCLHALQVEVQSLWLDMLDSYKETTYILPCLIQHESRHESTSTTGMKSIVLRQGRFQESDRKSVV